MQESARVQLCGTFAVELLGRRVDNMLPGRQGRVLFAYLVLSRLQPASRNELIDALWGDDRPANAGGALNALISKTRAVAGGDVLRGRTELILALPEPARVDVEAALSMLHAAESAVAIGAWRRAWSTCLGRFDSRTADILARGGGGAMGGGVASPSRRCPGARTRVLRQSLSGNRGYRVTSRGARRP
jgi:DNA-binding SARP family transcriptional activator